jgi:hypothetical protein
MNGQKVRRVLSKASAGTLLEGGGQFDGPDRNISH